MACVLEVLRGETNRRPIAPAEWRDAFQVAEQERVLPYFASRLRQSGTLLPATIQDDLARAEQEAARNSFWWTSELRGILKAFAAEALPVIPLKGPMLAERICGDLRLRQSCDLDLLVRHRDIDLASSLMEKLGFAELERTDYEISLRRGTTLVELHFDVENPATFDFDVAGAWRRASRRVFLGQTVWQFAPADELLFICLHGARHRFERVCHSLDVALALHCLTPEIDPTAYEHGPTAKLGSLVTLGRAMALRLDPRCGATLKPRASTRIAAHMEKLADRRWTALLEGHGSSLDWLDQHLFYLETEATAIGRLRRFAGDIRILATRLIQADFEFAAQLGVKQIGLVWMLRQFRLLARLCGLDLKTRINISASKIL